ncbi:MAG: aminodeoxychorismate synthase component I [Planctomycetes bacterium]|nr:aminodeoxychorismate synthase component I [Planctomycetota bacterium]
MSRRSLPLVEEVEWPADIPDWFQRLAGLGGVLFLDSARLDPHLGRYSYLTANPFEMIRSRHGRVEVIHACRRTRNEERGSRTEDRRPRIAEHGPKIENGDPLVVLHDRLDRWAMDCVAGLPPFQGGAAGLFSYDLCHHLERLPRPRFDEFEAPDLAVGLYDWVIALDHSSQQAWIISTGFPESASPRRSRHAKERLAQVKAWLGESRGTEVRRPKTEDREQPRSSILGPPSSSLYPPSSSLEPFTIAPQWPLPGPVGLTSNFSREGYLRAVERAIEYIYAGDVYQVNLSQRLLFPLCESPIELYLGLRQRNPAPFAGFFDAGHCVIVSSSPERFLRVQDGEVETRPIKGTRPRWPTPEADMYSAGELRESDKDRAENVMIVDLLRNDLGRVCEYGSVRVADPLRLESYEYVHHLVSEVRGRLRRSLGPIDLLRAAFPGGSVTGAPKIRAMEIIAELEPTARGPYCGSLGYLGFDGAMDTNILIRTFTCARGWVQFPVGGGIVAQSVPEREYEETLHKAEGMVRALSEK